MNLGGKPIFKIIFRSFFNKYCDVLINIALFDEIMVIIDEHMALFEPALLETAVREPALP